MKVRTAPNQIAEQFLKGCVTENVPILFTDNLVYSISQADTSTPLGDVVFKKSDLIYKGRVARDLLVNNVPVQRAIITNRNLPQYILTYIPPNTEDPFEVEIVHPTVFNSPIFTLTKNQPSQVQLLNKVCSQFPISITFGAKEATITIPKMEQDQFTLTSPEISFPYSVSVNQQGNIDVLILGHYRLQSTNPEGMDEQTLHKAIEKCFNLLG